MYNVTGRCGDPPVIEHATRDGSIGQKVFPLGTQLTYSCAPGYSLDGFFRAMCVGEGRWVGPRMTCSRMYRIVLLSFDTWRGGIYVHSQSPFMNGQ